MPHSHVKRCAPKARTSVAVDAFSGQAVNGAEPVSEEGWTCTVNVFLSSSSLLLTGACSWTVGGGAHQGQQGFILTHCLVQRLQAPSVLPLNRTKELIATALGRKSELKHELKRKGGGNAPVLFGAFHSLNTKLFE